MNLKKIVACCAVTLGLLTGSSVYAADMEDLRKLNEKAMDGGTKYIVQNNPCYCLSHYSENEETGVKNNLFVYSSTRFMGFSYETIWVEDGKKHIKHLFLKDEGRNGLPDGKLDNAWYNHHILEGERQVSREGGFIDLSDPKTKKEMQEKFDDAVNLFLND